jgi:hypothetical protein
MNAAAMLGEVGSVLRGVGGGRGVKTLAGVTNDDHDRIRRDLNGAVDSFAGIVCTAVQDGVSQTFLQGDHDVDFFLLVAAMLVKEIHDPVARGNHGGQVAGADEVLAERVLLSGLNGSLQASPLGRHRSPLVFGKVMVIVLAIFGCRSLQNGI